MDDPDDKEVFPAIRWKNMDDILAAVCIASLILLMFISIAMRYVVRMPLMWAEEVISLIFLWAIMLGAMSAQKARQHLSVDLLVVKFPRRLRAAVSALVRVTYMAVLAAMIIYGWELSMEAKDKITNMFSIPYTYIDLAIPVGSAGMLLYVAVDSYRALLRYFFPSGGRRPDRRP